MKIIFLLLKSIHKIFLLTNQTLQILTKIEKSMYLYIV